MSDFLSPHWRPKSGKGLFGAQSTVGQEKKTYTREEVALHNSEDDCWVIIDCKVYNVTKYISLHPGGASVLKNNAGKDTSVGFQKAKHSRRASDILADLYVGDLIVCFVCFSFSSQN